MKKSVTVETEETNSRTETETLSENTSRRISDPETKTSPSVSVN